MSDFEPDALIRPLAAKLHENHMSCLGIAQTMRLAHTYNQIKYREQDALRTLLYRDRLAALLEQNGAPQRPPIELHDGWAVDSSMALPHLDRILNDAETIIAERSGVRRSTQGTYRSYFQDVWTPDDLERFPSFLDFATSSELLSTVAHYLKSIPVLSATLPSGIRFVESNSAFDDRPDSAHDSQLYHIDYYSLPNVYVLVLLRDTTPEHGPWTFLPRSVSKRAAEALGNWGPGMGYRFTDEQVYAVADRKEVVEFCGPRGTVLFTESSGCMHYGSRNSIKPRFQLMLGYSGVCRTDFSEVLLTPKIYPIRPGDPVLRKLVLDRNMLL